MIATALVETAAAPVAGRPRTIRVALAGCGVVGSSLVRLLAERAAPLASEQGLRFELVRVLVREPGRPRALELAPSLLTADVDDFLAAKADLVVELLGGLDPAAQIARSTLAAGRRLVSANKALLAEHGAELAALAHRSGATLDFEGAVGGGIPLLRALRESLPGTGVRSLRGILNGTSNYILTRLAEGATYAAALADAQRAGFAEADPSRDLDGRDAADKLRILAWLAFGTDPATLPVRRRGILPDPDRLARAAATYGAVVRLVAECAALEDGDVAASVEPVAVAPDSELGRTRDEENILLIQTEWNGRIRLAGPGAGGFPTATAVLADMVRAAEPLAPRATAAASGEDPSTHRWIVGGDSLPRRIAALRQHLEAAGIAVSEQRQDATGATWLRTAPTPASAIDRALASFDVPGEAPLALRCEVGDTAIPAPLNP
jgi:homoserine dehydrogenase